MKSGLKEDLKKEEKKQEEKEIEEEVLKFLGEKGSAFTNYSFWGLTEEGFIHLIARAKLNGQKIIKLKSCLARKYSSEEFL